MSKAHQLIKRMRHKLAWNRRDSTAVRLMRFSWNGNQKWFFNWACDEWRDSWAQQDEHIETKVSLLTLMAVPVSCRRVVEHFGVMKIIGFLKPTLLDKRNDYELYQFPLGMVFLKMKNPSTKELHLEAVDPSRVEVREALYWRNLGWFVTADRLT